MIVHGLDLRHLEIFAHVVRAGGMTQAAKALGLTQPTVSGHIRSLEKEAGTTLLHRGGGRARPTAAGELLDRHARAICEIKDAAERELAEFLGLRQGELRIGASTTPATYYLPAFLARFTREHPGVEVLVSVGDTREILEALDEGKVEIALVGDAPDPGRYRARAVATDAIVLAVGRDHEWFGRRSVKLAELRGQKLIVREVGSATLASVEHALAAEGLSIGRDIPFALRLPTNEAIREAVAGGGGIAFLPRACLAGREADVRALSIPGLTIERAFTLVSSLSREAGPAARALDAMLAT